MKTQRATRLYRDLNKAVYDYNKAIIIDSEMANSPDDLVGIARKVIDAVRDLPQPVDAREEHRRDLMVDYARAVIGFYKAPVIRKTKTA